MVNIQDWVNKKYPNHWDKNQVKELHLNEPNLVGELDLSEFTKLRYEEGTIYLASFLDNKITFKNKSENTQIIKYLNVQNAFEREFPLYDTCLGEHDFSGWFWNAERLRIANVYYLDSARTKQDGHPIHVDETSFSFSTSQRSDLKKYIKEKIYQYYLDK